MTIVKGVAAVAWLLAANSWLVAQDAPPQPKSTNGVSVNLDSLTIQDFSQRVDEYVKLRKRIAASLPAAKSGSSATDLKQYQANLAQKISVERSQAKPGDIFTPAVSRLFRKLIEAPLKSSHGGEIRASLRHAEPVHGLSLAINQQYPQAFALQSTPPTLLSELPKLPTEIEYRIVGRELILLDSAADLIVDLLPDALPASQPGR